MQLGGLTTQRILEVFSQEMAAHQGKIIDTFDDGARLFTRAVLPRVEEARPNDRLRGGVALKASEQTVCLHPYVFRVVCSNGAIMRVGLGSEVIRKIMDRFFADGDKSRFGLSLKPVHGSPTAKARRRGVGVNRKSPFVGKVQNA